MKNKITYKEGPIEDVRIVADFLLSPDELAFREKMFESGHAPSKNELTFLDKAQDESLAR